MSEKVIRSARLKKLILDLADALGSNAKVYREWDVPRSTFYRWKKAHTEYGEAGLTRKKPRGFRVIHSPVTCCTKSTSTNLCLSAFYKLLLTSHLHESVNQFRQSISHRTALD